MSLLFTVGNTVFTAIYYALYLLLILAIVLANVPVIAHCKRFKRKLNKRIVRRFFNQNAYLIYLKRQIIRILVTTINCAESFNGWKKKLKVTAYSYYMYHKDNPEDYCKICYTDPLWVTPTIQLSLCKHAFHLDCVKTILKMRWNGAKISFQFRGCPLCKIPMKHPKIEHLNKELDILYDKLREKMLKRLKYEKLDKNWEIINENGKYYQDEIGFAMNKYAYYLCYKCDNPYYVGLKQCLAAGDNPDDDMSAEHFICLSCRDDNDENIESHLTNCPIHGSDYIEYKCKFCCSISTFSCGSTHFCELCHRKAGERWNEERNGTLNKSCPLLPNRDNYGLEEIEIDECPLGIKHPQHGTEYCLGCGLCRAQN